jgi:hypothetical protein
MNKFFISSALILFSLSLKPVAAQAQPLTECRQGPAEVEIMVDYAAPQENTAQTAAQIDAGFRNDPTATLSMDRRGIYVGFTRSPFNMTENFMFDTLANVHQACLSVKKATYTIIYHPEVYVASDFLKMACAYGVTVMHEKRHVDTYLQTVNDYIPAMKKAVEDYIAQMPASAPVPTAEADIRARQEEIVKQVRESLKPALEEFSKTNKERQALVDTPAAYAHDSAICPGQHPVFPAQ